MFGGPRRHSITTLNPFVREKAGNPANFPWRASSLYSAAALGNGMPITNRDAASESPSAFDLVAPEASGPALIVCDHATNFVPGWVADGDLGLSRADMNRHIAYDIGAAAVSLHLSRLLSAPAVLSRFSRLVIDHNRGTDDPTLVMKLYDGSIIPANRNAGPDEVARRRRLAYDPYHAAIAGQIDRMLAARVTPHILSIHSFTPRLRGKPPRPWQIGVLWDSRDGRIALPLLARLRAEPDLAVGDNEPYSGQIEGDCMHRHGTMRGLPHVLIEIRNDLIATAEGQKEWADRLAPILASLIPVA